MAGSVRYEVLVLHWYRTQIDQLMAIATLPYFTLAGCRYRAAVTTSLTPSKVNVLGREILD